MSATSAAYSTLPGIKARGKVRDIYDLGDRLMIVASDRISAFDVVMDDPVPGKGRLLTQMSLFWLRMLPACTPHHLDYAVTRAAVPPAFAAHAETLDGRAMVVHKAAVLPIECVVRGYLVGGGWKEYQASGSVSGVALPAGLPLAARLPEPIFTPSTKAASGHDEPVSFEQACELVAQSGVGAIRANAEQARAWLGEARRRSIAIYQQAAAHAERRGIILADTKFEFGLRLDTHELILIDEVLTPDSSRFWQASAWRTGISPPSYDKQYLRDYLESLPWPKQPPPPQIPAKVIAETLAKYEEAYRLLTS